MEERRRDEEAARRSEREEAADVEAVDEDVALAPVAGEDEGVARFAVDAQRRQVRRRRLHRRPAPLPAAQRAHPVARKLQREDLPTASISC